MTDEFLDFGYDPTIDEPIPDSRPTYVETLPASYTVTATSLPPVGQQGTAAHPGSPGSCAAWACTYGLATFTAAQAGRVEPSSSFGQASPAFIYIQVLKEVDPMATTCTGSQFFRYFNFLKAGGTPTMQAAPYVPDCSTLWQNYGGGASPPLDTAFTINTISSVPTADLNSVKQVLASDRALAYGTQLYSDWGSYVGDPVPYVGVPPIITNKQGKPAGHCMLIIGYDDTIGAVRLQNSQGMSWGSGGYVWMAYETFQTLAQGQALYVSD